MNGHTLVWHYTTISALRQIIESGFINPADKYVPKEERPITWFSANNVWENSAFKGYLHRDGRVEDLGMAGLIEHGYGVTRIGVALETAPLRWAELREQSGMSHQVGAGLARVARQWNANPSEWRGTFAAVPQDMWLAIETYNKDKWAWEPFLKATLKTLTETSCFQLIPKDGGNQNISYPILL
jgi:hypothetical protein